MDDIVRSAIDNVIDNIPNIVNSVFENEKTSFHLEYWKPSKKFLMMIWDMRIYMTKKKYYQVRNQLFGCNWVSIGFLYRSIWK